MTVSVRGHAMSDATQSTVLGIRKAIEIDLPPIARSDSQMEPYKDAQEIKIKYEAWQDNYAALKRAVLLAQALLQATIQYDTKYYNFRDYNGNGEGLLGLEIAFDVTETEITLTLNFHGKVRPAIWRQILQAAGSATAGGTGGTDVSGLTQGAFNDGEYGIPGVEAVYVGTGDLSTDDNLGLLESAATKFSLSFVKMGETTLLQPISKRFEFKNTIGMFQNIPETTLTALHDYTNTEQVITWVFKNGITIVFDKCTKLVEDPKLTDQNGIVTLRNEGMVFADPVNGTPNRVTFDDTNKVITFHRN